MFDVTEWTPESDREMAEDEFPGLGKNPKSGKPIIDQEGNIIFNRKRLKEIAELLSEEGGEGTPYIS